jgi:opine dehydrogenase
MIIVILLVYRPPGLEIVADCCYDWQSLLQLNTRILAMKVAVLGGGSGAHAMAADIALGGYEVRWGELPDYAEDIKAVQILGGIHLEGAALVGKEPGFAPIALATTDIAAAVSGADLVMVVVPAFRQQAYMRSLLDCVESGQVVVFNPGRFGPLIFQKMLAKAGRPQDFIIGGTVTLVYSARISGVARVKIKAYKNNVLFAAVPHLKTAEALALIKPIYPQFEAANTILETALGSPGIIMHPVSTLLNASRIEQMGPYHNSYYDITPSVGRVIDDLDLERRAIADKLGISGITIPEVLGKYYGAVGENSYEVIHNCDLYHSQTSPDRLSFRYVTEELPFGLVPIASLGEHLGLETTNIRSIIHLGEMTNEVDYWKTGCTVESFGFAGRSVAEIQEFVQTGVWCQDS